MVPARIGSQRLKAKNLALVAGKPLIAHAINAAASVSLFDKVFVNSDAPLFEKVAKRFGVGFYLRKQKLGSSETKSDEVVYDFMKAQKPDILVWVNPIAPLQTSEEIKSVVEYFINENLDSLITVEKKQVHAVYEGEPLNYDPADVFAQTQDLNAVSTFVYSVMMWRTDVFIDEYELNGSAMFCGNTGLYEVNKLSSFIVKDVQDLQLVDAILNANIKNNFQLLYDPILEASENG